MAMKPVKSTCADVPAEPRRRDIERSQTGRLEVVSEQSETKHFTISQGGKSDNFTTVNQQFQARRSGEHTETETTPPPSKNIRTLSCRRLLEQSLRQKTQRKPPVTRKLVKRVMSKIEGARTEFAQIYEQQEELCKLYESAGLKAANGGNLASLLSWYNSFQEITRFGHHDIKRNVCRTLGKNTIFSFLYDNADLILSFAYVNLDCLTELDVFEKQYLPENKSHEPEQHKRIIIFEKLVTQRLAAIQGILGIIKTDGSQKEVDAVKHDLQLLRLRYYFFIIKNILISAEYKNSLMNVHRDKFNISNMRQDLEEFCALCDKNVNYILSKQHGEIVNDILLLLCLSLVKICRNHLDSDSDFFDTDFFDIIVFIFSHQGLQKLLTTKRNYDLCRGDVVTWLDKTVKLLGEKNSLPAGYIITQLNECIKCPLLKKIKANAEKSVSGCKREKRESESVLESSDVIECFEKIDKMNTELTVKKQEVITWIVQSEQINFAKSGLAQKARLKITRYAQSESASASSSEGDGLRSDMCEPGDTIKPAAHTETDDFEKVQARIRTLFIRDCQNTANIGKRSALDALLTQLDELATAENNDGKTLDDKCIGIIKLAKVEAVWFQIGIQLGEILKDICVIQQYKCAFARDGFPGTYKLKDKFIITVKKIPGLCGDLTEIYHKLQREINVFKMTLAKSGAKILIDNFSLIFLGIRELFTPLSKVHSLPREVKQLCLMRRAALAEQYINKKSEQKQGLTSEEIEAGGHKSAEMLETINKLSASFFELEASVTDSAQRP